MPELFNIREHVCDPGTTDILVQRLYSGINLGVYVLDGLTYRDFYTRPLHELFEGFGNFPGLVNRFESATAEKLLTFAALKRLQGAVQPIVQMLRADFPSTSMKDFLEEDLLSSKPGLRKHFEEMERDSFKVPFMRQKADQKVAAREVFANGFLNSHDDPGQKGVGDWTAKDFYTREARKYPEIHRVIQDAKRVGVLDQKNNGYACRVSEQICVYVGRKFCTIINGVCSVNSDPE